MTSAPVNGNVTGAGEIAAGETLDRLAGEWWIFQLRDGHRYATDDVLTAWAACLARPRPERIADLGAGVGALGLMVLLRAPAPARLTCVERQAVSAALLRRTIAHNGLQLRCQVIEGDLREALERRRGGGAGSPRAATTSIEDAARRFDLIVANPPYLPEGSALRSPHPQRAAARLELHGDIFDYCRAAARYLDEDGRFCFCYPAADPRPERAVEAAGLTLLERRDVVFREGRPPALALHTCGRRGERRDAATLCVRDRQGNRTDAYRAVRRAMLIEA